jgi:hypothetical protein
MARKHHVQYCPVCSFKAEFERLIKRTAKEGAIKEESLRLRIRIVSEFCVELCDSFLSRFAVVFAFLFHLKNISAQKNIERSPPSSSDGRHRNRLEGRQGYGLGKKWFPHDGVETRLSPN